MERKKNIQFEEYRRKNILLEIEMLIYGPLYSCDENFISYTQYKN